VVILLTLIQIGLEDLNMKQKIYDDWADIAQALQIEYALRDEKVNIFAMTKGIPSSTYPSSNSL